MRKTGAAPSWQTAQDTPLLKRGAVDCACAGRSRVSPSNAASSSHGIPRPGSFNTWQPTSHRALLLALLDEVAKAYRLRWQVELLPRSKEMEVPMRTCMPSIPRTPPSSKG